MKHYGFDFKEILFVLISRQLLVRATGGEREENGWRRVHTPGDVEESLLLIHSMSALVFPSHCCVE